MHDTSKPQDAAVPGDPALLGYMTLERLGLDPAGLDFYQLLLSCTGEDAAGEKRRHAVHFRLAGYGRASFIGSLAALPAPLLRFPLWRTELERVPGELPRDALLDCVHGQLGQPPGAFLASPGWKMAQADIWQSLLALALSSGQLADAALMAQLTDVLRVGYFLRLLDGSLCSLALHAERRAALTARLVWPDVAAPGPAG